MKNVTAKEAAVFISEQKMAAKGRVGEELADSSREQIKRHCRTIFDAAIAWGHIKCNPFKSVRLKKLDTTRWHRVTPKEYHALLDVAPSLRLKVFYALAYTSGAAGFKRKSGD